MSIQDKLEQVLKEIHVTFSKSDVYMDSPDKIIINKREMFDLLEKLNLCVYEMMDFYEVTSQSRELAQRKQEKKGAEIIDSASKQAEDVYAASIVYTNDALGFIQDIVMDASKNIENVLQKVNGKLIKEKEQIQLNQSELREQLQDFKDTDKYLRIIEDLNKEREKEHIKQAENNVKKKINNESKDTKNSLNIPKPEIKINEAYFEKIGRSDYNDNSYEMEASDIDALPVIDVQSVMDELRAEKESNSDNNSSSKSFQDISAQQIEHESHTQEVPMMIPEINVDLDAEYFKWKENEETTEEEDKPKEKRKLFFGKRDKK